MKCIEYFSTSEHDACATDISELQWHVGYMGRQLDRYRHRVEVAEVLNTQLKDDIAFVKKHWYVNIFHSPYLP